MSTNVYNAYEVKDGKKSKPLGQISIERGVLTIVSLSNESDRKSVQASIDEFNNRPFLAETAPPPESDKRYGVGAKELKRGESGFDEMLIRKLESSRQIRLEKR